MAGAFASLACMGALLYGRPAHRASPSRAAVAVMAGGERTYFATCIKGMEPVLASELRGAQVGVRNAANYEK